MGAEVGVGADFLSTEPESELKSVKACRLCPATNTAHYTNCINKFMHCGHALACWPVTTSEFDLNHSPVSATYRRNQGSPLFTHRRRRCCWRSPRCSGWSRAPASCRGTRPSERRSSTDRGPDNIYRNGQRQWLRHPSFRLADVVSLIIGLRRHSKNGGYFAWGTMTDRSRGHGVNALAAS